MDQQSAGEPEKTAAARSKRYREKRKKNIGTDAYRAWERNRKKIQREKK